MEYRKNDIVTLKIEDCGIDGEDHESEEKLWIWTAGGDSNALPG